MIWQPGRQLSDVLESSRLELPGCDPGPNSGSSFQNGRPHTVNNNSNTKGSWVEVVSALTDHCYGILVARYSDFGSSRTYLVDIGVGGSGSEAVLVANIELGGVGSAGLHMFHLPIFIRAGTRVAARHQNDQNEGATRDDWYRFFSVPTLRPPLCRASQTYGANTATTRGTTIDPGGTANTKSGWVELTASTTARMRWLSLIHGNRQNAGRSDYSWQVDVAIGAAGSEDMIIADLNTRNSGNFNCFAPEYAGPFPVDIPTGTRISARASCSGTDATDRLIEAIAYGFSV